MLVAGLIAVCLVCAAQTARGDDAQSLLAKNKAFAGWSFGDPSMASIRLIGKIGGASVNELRRGAIWRRTMRYRGNLTRGIGFTGQRYWYANENGFVVPIVGDGAKYELDYQMVMNQAIPLLSGTPHGSATIGSTPTEIVRVSPDNAFPIDAYIDPASGRMVRAVIDPDGIDRTIDVLGYADVDGKKLIANWREGSTTGEYTKIARITIMDDAFHPPAPTATWTFDSPAALPITFGHQRILIRAKINGVEGNFELDSGSASIAVNSDFARRAHLTEFVHTTGMGMNGTFGASLDRADTIEIGSNVLHNVIVEEGIDIHGAHEDADGLFGFDFLAGAIVDFDLAKNQMTIYDPAKFAVTAQGPAVPIDLSRALPTIPVTFNGRVKAHLIFDTGDPMSVWASEKLYGPRGVDMRLEFHTQTIGGASGDSQKTASCGHTNTMEIGAIRYEHVPVCFGPVPDGLFGNDGGIIGIDFLKHFDLTFDYPESALYLTPTGK